MASADVDTVGKNLQSPIPVVDLGPFTNSSSEQERLVKAKDLVAACKNVGFAYIINHGVPKEQLDLVFEQSKRFFALPIDDKKKAPHPPGSLIYRGYSWPGLEKVSNASSKEGDQEVVDKLREVQDFKESYDIGSDENVEEPNVWLPEEIMPRLRNTMTSFYWSCWNASKTVLTALALGLGIEEERLLDLYNNGHHNQLRLLHYPAIPARHIETGQLARMPAHTDWSTFTILFQDDCGGLQVESLMEPGQFLDVEPIEGTIVLNIGDLLMRWSNDYLKSTQHRVRLPPLQDRYTGNERMTRARYSIPYFVTTQPDAVIECLRFDDGSPRYEPMTRREYADMRARMSY